MTEDIKGKIKKSPDYLAECLTIAREASGKSVSDCSRFLGITPSRLRNYESGKLSPSLPEIESLSFIYHIPLPFLLDPQLLSKQIHTPDAQQMQQLLMIRQEIIATRIQLAREKCGKTQNEVAEKAALPISHLKKYESGEISIPLNDLIRIAEAVDLDLGELLDRESPIGNWQVEQEKSQQFSLLSEEDQSFALSADNQSYIAFTQRIKALGKANLSRLSESIQQILDAFRQE
jgi:transcriptional regulator with XRE-family HTH domain